MRILHVVPSYYPAVRYGGPIRSVHGLARALVSRGHEVHVYTTNVDGPKDADVPIGNAVDLDGVSVWYFPTGIGRRLYRSPAMGLALDQSISDFDVVHTHSVFLWPTTAAARAALKHRIPYILAPRGMLVPELIRRKSRFLKLSWLRTIERRNLEAAAAIHVTSNQEAEDLRRLGLRYKKCVIVPNGVEAPDPGRVGKGHQRWWNERRARILFLGRVNWKKGLDRLINAMSLLPEADLVIAGDDDDGYRATLEALAGDLGVADRVLFIGPLHGQEKWELLASAQVLALPSYSENFGNVVLEAMAMSCPVVVTPEVGLADLLIKSGAGEVVSGDPKCLARALHGLLADSSKAQRMGALGCTIVKQQFAWAGIAEEMEKVYFEITATERARYSCREGAASQHACRSRVLYREPQ
jgi:glycosyltransferase involved in cell wall biosynthesis